MASARYHVFGYICFSRHLKDVVKVNFDPLLQNISCDVERWATLNLSMAGKVNVLKMNCVPKRNYIIQSLPLEIPHYYFKRFDRISKIFLWNGKRPRLSHSKLQRPADKGGLGLSNMLFYYNAFNLRHLAHWSLPPERAPPWYCLEQAVVAPLSPMQVLSTKLSIKAKTHPIHAHLKLIWTRVAQIFKFDPFLNVSSSIWLNPKLRIDKFSYLLEDMAGEGSGHFGGSVL